MTKIVNYLVGFGLLALVVIIGISALPFPIMDTLWSGDSASLQTITILGTPWYLVVAAPIILFLGWYLGSRRKAEALILLTVAIILFIFFYKTKMFEMGHTRLFSYFLAIGVAAFTFGLAFKGSSRGEKFTPAVLSAVMFAIVGFSHPWPADPNKTFGDVTYEWATRQPPPKSRSATIPAPQAPTSRCNGIRLPLTLGPDFKVKMEDCAFDIVINEKEWCIYFERAAWTNDRTVYGPYCNEGNPNSRPVPPVPHDTALVWSASGILTGAIAYQPSPARATQQSRGGNNPYAALTIRGEIGLGSR